MLGGAALAVSTGHPTAAEESGPLADLIAKAHAARLAEQRYWHLLLHYRRTVYGGFRSEADGRGFFLSPRGKMDPAAELDATLAAFFEPLSPVPEDPNLQHPQCRFPARYAWLKRQLGFDPALLPEQPCERFQNWKSRLDAGGVTMIFASAYLDNPATMYGHTFLRLDQRGHRAGERILDYTVNFAAVANTRNGILFAFFGLMGGYPGRFSTMPYYIKIQEYSHLENRDLWEYQLNLGPEQVDRLVMHLWEMGTTYFDYYFLTENCSYQLLPLLEVADPSLHLTDAFHLRVIPVDTLRILLEQPGLVTGVRYRPSHSTRMLRRRSLLAADEIRTAQRIAERPDEEPLGALERHPPERRVSILDAAYDYFRYRQGYRWNQDEAALRHGRQILLLRSELGRQPTDDPAPPPAARPESGHRTGRIGVGVGSTREAAFQELSLRAALHDLPAQDAGYTPDSQLEMFHLQLRYDDETAKLFLENLTFVQILSLAPRDRWIRKPSWAFGFGLDLAKETGCTEGSGCLYFGVHAGKGYAFQTHLWRRETLYALAEADLGAGRVFAHDYRVGGGGKAGIAFDLAPFWRAHLEGTYLRYPLGDTRPRRGGRLDQAFPLSKNLELRLTLESEESYREAVFAANFYL